MVIGDRGHIRIVALGIGLGRYWCGQQSQRHREADKTERYSLHSRSFVICKGGESFASDGVGGRNVHSIRLLDYGHAPQSRKVRASWARFRAAKEGAILGSHPFSERKTTYDSFVLPRSFPLVIVLLHAAAGCVCLPFDPRLQASLDADDPVLKIPAIADAAALDGEEELHRLVDALEHRDEAVRLFAIEALKLRTGQDFGYRPYDSPREREEAVARWRRWLAGEDPVRCQPEGS